MIKRGFEKFTDEFISKLPRKEKTYKISDGKNLFLSVPPEGKGNMRWRFKYRFNHKENQLGLGTYPDVSIKEARKKLKELKALINDGIDPSLRRKELKSRTMVEYAAVKLKKTEIEYRVMALENKLRKVMELLIKSGSNYKLMEEFLK